MNTRNTQSFTLIELIVVIVIVASMASFALVNYNQSMQAAHERDAVMQLKTIHAAESIYFAKSEGEYWPLGSSAYDLSAINANLNIYIVGGDITYSCFGSDGSTFDCSGTYSTFEVTIDEGAVGTGNPCCSSGACPTLADCI